MTFTSLGQNSQLSVNSARYFLVFLAIDLGWSLNCFPFFISLRFLALVFLYSSSVRESIAFAGKYRSPVLLDFLPLLVLQSWSPQSFNDF